MTSLIEQAAKRLEELKRAGIDPSERASAPHETASSTPEAMVLALERSSSSAARPLGKQREIANDAASDDARIRRITIDFARLHARGFVTPDAGLSKIAEEFRVIKRPIIRNAFGPIGARVKNGNLVMVTSALPAEGKTFTSVNLALSIATEIDSTVLLVDGDVAHPAIPELLGAPQGPGLLDLLTDDRLRFTNALVKTNVDKLSILPAGSRHRRSTELLASEQMAALLRDIASRYSDRIVIFDSPPLLATTEARVLASSMGQIVMVVAADATSQHAVNQALATVEACEVVMMVLNKASRSDVGNYYGYYGNGDAG